MILHDVIIKNTNSEPRDVLMTERTAFSWIKFALSLSVIAVAVITDFRFPINNEDDPQNKGSGEESGFNLMAVSIVFICLSLGCIFFGAFGYFQMVRGYDLHKVIVLKFEYSMLYLFIMCVVIIGINGGLIYNSR